MVDSYDFISKYILINRIDQGGYGKVYKAYSRHLNTCVAVKIFKNKLSAKTEWKVITKLQGVKGIPLVYDFITGAHETLFTMQLLGSNLMRFTSIFQSYSYKPLNKIVLEGLKILKKLHKKHYVHNDIKPNQFLVSQDFKKVFLVDFGLSQKFSQKSVHRPMKEENSRAGNCIFSSINWHRWLTLSRRDDLVSFAYMIIYLAKGSLPWENMNINKFGSRKARSQAIYTLKLNISDTELCLGLPNQFIQLLEYAKSLTFEQKPKYNYFIKLFKENSESNLRSILITNAHSLELLVYENENRKNENRSQTNDENRDREYYQYIITEKADLPEFKRKIENR